VSALWQAWTCICGSHFFETKVTVSYGGMTLSTPAACLTLSGQHARVGASHVRRENLQQALVYAGKQQGL